MSSTVADQTEREQGRFYVVEADGVEYRFDHEEVTAIEIMDRAGIPHSVGMVQILEDGTQQTVPVDATFDLKPGRRFKKRPSFRRG